MPYGKVYQITFQPEGTPSGSLIIIRFHDADTFSSSPGMEEGVFILNDDHGRVPKGNLQVITIDDSEDPFTPVKGSKAVCSFFSSNTFNLNTFLDGDDDRWFVKIWKDTVDAGNVLWLGYLVTSELSEAYQAYPNVVTLTATDNIGLLRDTPLTDFNGENPKGYHRIIEYIAWSLDKTGLTLPILAINNLKEENNPTIPWYQSCYLDAKTFESEIGKCEDCYTVLQKILGEDSFLFQWQGRWQIVRKNEMDSNDIYQQFWDADGTYNNMQAPVNLTQQVGSYSFGGQEPYWISETATVSAELKHGKIIEKYNYVLPLEIPDNVNFARGRDFLGIIPVDMSFYIKVYANLGAFPTQGEVELTYKANDTGFFYKYTGTGGYILITGTEAHSGAAYVLEDWTLERQTGAIEIAAYVAKISLQGYDKATYAVLSAGQTAQHWIKSNPVPVHLSDKISLSVDRRLSANQTGSGNATEFFAQVRLFGNDGTFWTLNGGGLSEPEGTWVQCTSSFTTNQRYLQVTYSINDNDEREWMGGSVESRPIPVAGHLEILLLASSVYGNVVQTHFQNLSFDYIPFINGSYRKYSGQSNEVSQAGNLKAKRETDVHISNGPKLLFKGAIIRDDGGKKVLAGRFYEGYLSPLAPPTLDTDYHTFGWIQAYAVWNQFRKIMRIFDGDYDGLRLTETVDKIPDLVHKYVLTDSNPHANNRYFMLLHKVQDFDTNMLSGRLIEILYIREGKTYSDTYQFKYISD